MLGPSFSTFNRIRLNISIKIIFIGLDKSLNEKNKQDQSCKKMNFFYQIQQYADIGLTALSIFINKILRIESFFYRLLVLWLS